MKKLILKKLWRYERAQEHKDHDWARAFNYVQGEVGSGRMTKEAGYDYLVKRNLQLISEYQRTCIDLGHVEEFVVRGDLQGYINYIKQKYGKVDEEVTKNNFLALSEYIVNE